MNQIHPEIIAQCINEAINLTHAMAAGGGGTTTILALLGYNHLKNKRAEKKSDNE